MAERYPHRDEPYRSGRGFTDRARDEVRSWFGDEDAERRRRVDMRDRGSVGDYGGGWAPAPHRSDERGYEAFDPGRRFGAGDRWTGANSRDEYDHSRATFRGWNEPVYGYRPAFGFGHGDWNRDAENRQSREPGETRGYYEDQSGRTYEFDRFESRSFAGRGPKGYRRSDERIREDVCDRLADDSRVDATEIEVMVKDGEVTLAGTVCTRDEKRRGEDLAETISGVRDVHNNLRVKPTTGSGAAPSGVPS